MTPERMDELIERHIAAERDGDSQGAVAVYTEDVEHDVVGAPHGPLRGREQAKGFYDWLIANVAVEEMACTLRRHGSDFCVTEHLCTGVVNGEFLGVPGHGRRISFRLLHLWEFRDDLIGRENIWMDGGSVVAQLTAPEAAGSRAS